MEKIVYNSLSDYFLALSRTGYVNYNVSYKLLVLTFIKDIIYNDYRGFIEKSDYQDIEKALNCLYGTTCLIPYPDYCKMGRLHIGEISELAHRICEIDEGNKALENHLKLNDAVTNNNTNRLDVAEAQIAELESTKVVKGKQDVMVVPDINIEI